MNKSILAANDFKNRCPQLPFFTPNFPAVFGNVKKTSGLLDS